MKASFDFDGADLRGFARQVREMRAKQNDYFRKGRQPSDLAESKRLEREVDRRVEAILQGPALFGEEGDHEHRGPKPLQEPKQS